MTATTYTGSVVVGTDGSHAAQLAVEWAAREASERGNPLAIVLAITPRPVPKRGADGTPGSPEFSHLLRQRGDAALADAAQWVRQTRPELRVTTALFESDAARALVEASHTADLVVVGARGTNSAIRLPVLGGTADAVVTHAHCPVMVVPESARMDADGPVVVGIDDSPASLDAARFAFESAHRHACGVLAVYSWDITAISADPTMPTLIDMDSVISGLDEMVSDALKPLSAEFPDVAVERRVCVGRASSTLIQESAHASLVVVGSRGRGGFRGLLLGSTSREVTRGAKCPVVIIRRPERSR